jgi:hypothetical protein
MPAKMHVMACCVPDKEEKMYVFKTEGLEILETAKVVQTSEFFYDLFDGGYIDPSLILVEEDAARVNEAIRLILEFRETLEENDMVEYS